MSIFVNTSLSIFVNTLSIFVNTCAVWWTGCAENAGAMGGSSKPGIQPFIAGLLDHDQGQGFEFRHARGNRLLGFQAKQRHFRYEMPVADPDKRSDPGRIRVVLPRENVINQRPVNEVGFVGESGVGDARLVDVYRVFHLTPFTELQRMHIV